MLCAVVKFDGRQQQEIQEHEEQRQSLVSVEGKADNSQLGEQHKHFKQVYKLIYVCEQRFFWKSILSNVNLCLIIHDAALFRFFL